MSDFIDKTCPYCQAVIKPGERLAYCSKCSTAYHEKCWVEGGGCTTPACSGKALFEKTDGNDITAETVQDNSIYETTASFCSNCGARRNSGAKFCPQCGRGFEDIAAGNDKYIPPHTAGSIPHNSRPRKTENPSPRKLSRLLISLAAAGILIALAVTAVPWLKEESNYYGNTVGNIVNGGIVARQGDWIYYRNDSDEKYLYKIRTDGSGRSIVE